MKSRRVRHLNSVEVKRKGSMKKEDSKIGTEFFKKKAWLCYHGENICSVLTCFVYKVGKQPF